MSNKVARYAPRCAAGILAAAMVAACDQGSGNPEVSNQIGSVSTDAPLAARIGNIATADLIAVGDSGVSGTVNFAEVDNGLLVEAMVTGLAPGLHGFHIHEVGDCSAADASSAGGHLAPGDEPHGAPNAAPGQRHAGDLGNVDAGPDGSAALTLTDPVMTLVGDAGVVGRAVIVHGGADDLASQPSGDAGPRVACGVVEWGTDSASSG